MAERGLRVFVSSSIGELTVERDHVRRALAELDLVSFTYENDAPATMESHQAVWRGALIDSGICVAIIHRKVGIYTQDEINTARQEGIPLLVYRRLLEEGEHLAPEEQAFVDELDHPVSGIALRLYDDPTSLAKRVRHDIPDLLAEWAKRIRKILKAERAEATGVRHTAEPTARGLATEETKGPGVRPLPLEEARRITPHEGAFVGRTGELAKLRSLLGMADRRMAVVGEAGSGRKAILRHFAHAGDMGDGFDHGAGIHPFQTPSDDLEDLRQAIWEEFFVAADDDPSLVNPRRRRRDLRDRKALIFLLDLELGDDDIKELVADMPESTFVFTRPTDAAWSAKRIELSPLDADDDVVALFEDRYNGSVPAAARDAVLTIARNVGGLPARIEMLANRAWDEATDPGTDTPDHPLIAWAAEKAAWPAQQLLTWLIPGIEIEVAEVMAAVDTHTPREVLAEVIDLRRVDLALVDGTAVSASPRYALNPALAEAVDIEGERAALLAQVFRATMTWVADADHDRIYAERAFVLRMLAHAESVGDHAGVIALARATEHAFAMGGRHGAWRVALEKAKAAGEALDDAETTSWALHQLGTRALLRGELDDAREHLHDALEIRENNDDTEAAALTRATLHHVPMALTSVASLILAVILAAVWGWALVTEPGWDPPEFALDIETLEAELRGPGEPLSLALTVDGGDDPFALTDVDVRGEGAVFVDSDCVGQPATTRLECVMEVDLADGENSTPLEVTITGIEDTDDPRSTTASRSVEAPPPTTTTSSSSSSSTSTSTTTVAPPVDFELVVDRLTAEPDTIGVGEEKVALQMVVRGSVPFAVEDLVVRSGRAEVPILDGPSCLGLDVERSATCEVTVELVSDPGEAVLDVTLVGLAGADRAEASGRVTVTVVDPDPEFEITTIVATPQPVQESNLVTLAIRLAARGQDIGVTEVDVVADGQQRSPNATTCVDLTVTRTDACEVLVEAVGEGDVIYELTLAGIGLDDGRAYTATESLVVQVSGIDSTTAAAPIVTAGAVTVSGGEVSIPYTITNQDAENSLTGLFIVDAVDSGRATACGSATLGMGSSTTCTVTFAPSGDELAARQATSRIEVAAVELPVPFLANPEVATFATVSAAFQLGSGTVADVVVTLAGRTIGGGGTVAVPQGISTISFSVPSTVTVTPTCDPAVSSLTGGPVRYTAEVTVAGATNAGCAFNLEGRAVLDIEPEAILLGPGEADTFAIRNVGSKPASAFTFTVPVGFVATSPCGSELAVGATCEVTVRSTSTPPAPVQDWLVVSYAGGPGGDSRVLLSVSP